MKKSLRLGLLSLLFMSAAGVIVYTQLEQPPVTHDGTDEPFDVGGPFDLIDQNGKRRTSEEFKGKYMIVYFGYSYCPDVCPKALQTISSTMQSLVRDRSEFVPIFITLDPKRDTKDQLKLYSENYDKNFIFLTGSQEDIAPTSKAYKTFAREIESEHTTDYLVDHSSLIYIMNKEGKLVAYFPHDVDPEKFRTALTHIIAKDHTAAHQKAKKASI